MSRQQSHPIIIVHDALGFTDRRRSETQMFGNVCSRDSYYFRCATLCTLVMHVAVVAGSHWYSSRWNTSAELSPSSNRMADVNGSPAPGVTPQSAGGNGRAAVTVPRYCQATADCGDASLGQTCHWLYDGCRKGRCMCDPRRHRQGSNGKCTPLKDENELCTEAEGDICQGGMECYSGRCRCPEGAHLTPDGLYCLRPGEKLLGQRCVHSVDVCLHKSTNGYTRYDAFCSQITHQCSCAEGYKADGVACRKWNIDECGCRRSIHCEGGALCVDGRCSCPVATHVAIAGNSKCARIGAIIDLQSGAVCDEINELRYCARSLVCLRCPDDNVYKCVRFLMTSEYAFLGSSSEGINRQRLDDVIAPIVVMLTTSFRLASFFVNR